MLWQRNGSISTGSFSGFDVKTGILKLQKRHVHAIIWRQAGLIQRESFIFCNFYFAKILGYKNYDKLKAYIDRK